jgi:co-chaperonin GroES (HSP10)
VGVLTISGARVYATGGDANDNSYGIYVYSGELRIEDGADVTATGRNADSSYGIYADSLTINNGTRVFATGGTAYIESIGINVYASLTIDGAEVTAIGRDVETMNNSNSYGIYVGENLSIKNDAIVNASSGKAENTSFGIYAEGPLTIESGADVEATGGNTTSGESAGIAVLFGGNLAISNAKVTATGGDAENGSYGIYVSSVNLTINNNANVTATGKGATANTNNSHGIYVYNGDLTITGATVEATGGMATMGNSFGIQTNYLNLQNFQSGIVTMSGEDRAIFHANGDYNVPLGVWFQTANNSAGNSPTPSVYSNGSEYITNAHQWAHLTTTAP